METLSSYVYSEEFVDLRKILKFRLLQKSSDHGLFTEPEKFLGTCFPLLLRLTM